MSSELREEQNERLRRKLEELYADFGDPPPEVDDSRWDHGYKLALRTLWRHMVGTDEEPLHE